nr:MAG TPA: hypothetical protein [Caudoviricetes sp.]
MKIQGRDIRRLNARTQRETTLCCRFLALREML